MTFTKRHVTKMGERGVTTVEYGIMAALIATALVTSISYFTGGLSTAFSKIASTMTGAT